MLEIGKTLVSLEVINSNFQCNPNVCKGACCIYGDSGAPLEPGEARILEQILPVLIPYLSEKSFRTLEKIGTSVIDIEKDLVTPLNEGKECVYTIFENGIARCAIEKAFFDGTITFRKPISCFLYPIRIKKFSQFEAVNYDRWDICQSAMKLGDRKQIPVYRFAKDALIARYGREWYQELESAAENLDIV
jgi:hypothetical protein